MVGHYYRATGNLAAEPMDVIANLLGDAGWFDARVARGDQVGRRRDREQDAADGKRSGGQ